MVRDIRYTSREAPRLLRPPPSVTIRTSSRLHLLLTFPWDRDPNLVDA
jgi:hypothetical protein